MLCDKETCTSYPVIFTALFAESLDANSLFKMIIAIMILVVLSRIWGFEHTKPYRGILLSQCLLLIRWLVGFLKIRKERKNVRLKYKP